MMEPKDAQAALGFRAHSGWAAAIALAESGKTLVVLERLRIELADPRVKGFPQPYHAAEPLPLSEARKLIEECVAASGRLALTGIRAVIENLRKRGHEAVACGLVTGSGRPLPPLEGVLASHALIHTAEGVMFREALQRAAEVVHLLVRPVKEREAYEEAARVLSIDVSEIRGRLAVAGKSAGPPWKEDQKLAALAAWMALRERR